ncbi:MAG: CHAT domain-containing tetratricopeptide repeat protein, partial [Bacteroidota bacterium]
DKIGLSYQSLQLFAEARLRHEAAAELLSQFSNGGHPHLSVVYNHLGNTYVKEGAFDKALNQYRLGLNFSLRRKNINPVVEATLENNIGLCMMEKKRWAAAEEYFIAALKKKKNHPAYLKNLALVAFHRRDSLRAQNLIQQAISANGFQKGQPFYGDKIKLIELLGLQAKWGAKTSESAYELPLALADSFQVQQQTAFRKQWKTVLLQLYKDAVWYFYQQWQASADRRYLEKAFQITEKGRSFSLRQALRSTNAKSFSGIPDSLLQSEEQLYLQIQNLEIQYLNANASSQEILDQRLFQLHQKQRRLVRRLEQSYPAYHKLKYADEALELPALQAQLAENQQMLLSYYQLDSTLLAFIIHKDGLSAIPLTINGDLQQQISDLRKQIQLYTQIDATQIDSLNRAFSQQSHQLYQQLLEPLQSKFPPLQRLVILPDGPLHFLPFELLLTQSVSQISRFKQHPYFLRQYAISYEHSTSLLLQQARTSTTAGGKLLAFAPDFSENSFGLANLRYNVAEADAVAALFKGRLIKGKQATRTQFLQNAPLYDLILLATHAEANPRSGEYSWMAFSETPDTINGSLLYAKDLYGLRLPAQMVVLSACETGIGEFEKGEGVLSLSRGFFYAGAKSIVNTLWSVDDARNSALIQLFFQELKQGKPKDVAMQQAKLSFLTQHPNDEAHPVFWAGPVLTGQLAPLKMGSSKRYIWWGFFLFSSLFLFLYFFRKRISL